MAAVTARTVTAPPSPFAALLRRSKFASYDPKIGQVYTTFGGDAHRGNYGLKRPLALRKRQAFIRVSAVDSRHQQTEWNSAEKEARWIKKFEEVGRLPQIVYDSPMWKMSGPTGQIPWEVDTDFALGVGEPALAKPNDEKVRSRSPNIAAMSPKRFKRHLEKLRQLRPAFREYLEETAKHEKTISTPKPSVRSTDLLEQAQYQTQLHKTFLSHQSRKEMESLDSHVIEQQLHPNAALSYTHSPDLQHFFLKKPLPGRALEPIPAKRGRKGLTTAFAGMAAELPQVRSEAIMPMDWKTLVEHGVDTERGISDFRVANAQLGKPPVVVGSRPAGLESMEMEITVSSHGKVDMTRPNPHLPWTREYIAHISDAVTPDLPKMTKPQRRQQIDLNAKTLPGKDVGEKLLNTLAGMISKE